MMARQATLLVVGGQPEDRQHLGRQFESQQFRVVSAGGTERELRQLADPPDVTVVLPGPSDRDVLVALRACQRHLPQVPLVVLTAPHQIRCAVESIKCGVADCIPLPLAPDQLAERLRRHLPQRLGGLPPLAGSDQERRPPGFDELVGDCPQMQDVYERIRQAAATDSTVLVTGESGTGKELVARAIHRHSGRCGGPFLATNMAAVAETLIESELFGHVHGAFTGAEKARMGRFQAADGGTLFIDEVGDLKWTSQAKLLRVLETRHITPVGGNDDLAVDVRVVAATHRDLAAAVREAQFRGDLYYRIHVVRIELPPLRERGDDVLLLADFFIQRFCRHARRPPPALDELLVELLRNHPWPGNVRQLHNCIESMLVLSDRPLLGLDDVPPHLLPGTCARSRSLRIPPGRKLHELEKMVILHMLDRHDGNRLHTARSLGISVRTLQRKLRRWGRLNTHSRG